jgi:hypothetical protein
MKNFDNLLIKTLEDMSTRSAKGTKTQKQSKTLIKTPKNPKRKLKIDIEALQDQIAFYEYNKDINKYEIYVKLKDNTKEVLYVRNNPNASKTMLINAKGHGSKLKALKINTIKLTTKEGESNTITKESILNSKPKSPKSSTKTDIKHKVSKKETQEVNSEKKPEVEKKERKPKPPWKPIKVTLYGCDKLEGQTMKGIIVGMGGGSYVVEPVHKDGLKYQLSFSTKNGYQKDNHNPFHSWKLNLDDVKKPSRNLK